jgi:hypothetical protein
MEKENIYVTIDSEEKRLRAIEILEKAGEEILYGSAIFIKTDSVFKHLLYDIKSNRWLMSMFNDKKQEIILDELELLLGTSVDHTSYVVKDVVLSIDELKAQAVALGYDLVEKPYEPKVGDFGVFWDHENEKMHCIGFIGEVFSDGFNTTGEIAFNHFRKLTDEEKTLIQKSW